MSQSAPDKRSISLADGLAASAAVAVFIIGICAILGWHLGIIDLVRPFPSYGSMKHNTALGLMLSGFGMGALLFDRTAWARIASLLVVGIAAATLTQLVTGVDLGIDQLLVLDPVPSAFPGRPAANTAFALLCIGVALFVAAFPPSRHRAALVGVLASLVLAIVTAATLGFATGTEYAYTWLGLGQMAPHTAAGLGIAALGLFRFAWEDANAHALGPSWLPSACFIGGITLSIILGASLRVSERQQNQRADQLQAENVAREVRTRFWSPVFSLLRMAERWTLTEQPSKERFEISSRLNFRDFHGLEAMEIVDPEGEIVWTSLAPDAPDATSIALLPAP